MAECNITPFPLYTGEAVCTGATEQEKMDRWCAWNAYAKDEFIPAIGTFATELETCITWISEQVETIETDTNEVHQWHDSVIDALNNKIGENPTVLLNAPIILSPVYEVVDNIINITDDFNANNFDVERRVQDITYVKISRNGIVEQEFSVTNGDLNIIPILNLLPTTEYTASVAVGADGHVSAFVEFEFTSLETPPNVENLIVAIPQSAYIGGNFNISISGATSDNPFTYSVDGSDFTFSKNNNIAENEEIIVSVNSSSTAEVKTIYIRAIDSNGNISTIFEKTIEIIAPTGSTEEFTSDVSVSIPKEATLLTVKGHGSGGVASVSASGGYRYYNSCGGSTFSTYIGATAYMPGNPCNTTVPYVGRENEAVEAQPGIPSTISGSISYTFAGASTGVTTTPLTTEEIINLPESTEDYIFDLTIPSGGMIQLEWE